MSREIDTMKTLRFGIEIETVGLSRPTLASAIARALNGVVDSSLSDRRIAIRLADGREWTVVADASLSDSYASGEIVSPILSYADLDMLQTVVRAVRVAGARVDTSCGIHVHVDGSQLDPRALVRLVTNVHAHEEILFSGLGVQSRRRERFCRPLSPAFVALVKKYATTEQIAREWYEGSVERRRNRYDTSRYHGCNLHSYFYRGTVEFRYFEATLHAGKVKAYVQLCLAFAARAIVSKAAAPKVKALDPVTLKYRMRDLVTRLGLNGPEFKTARYHLVDVLPGTSSNPQRARARAAAGPVAARVEREDV